MIDGIINNSSSLVKKTVRIFRFKKRSKAKRQEQSNVKKDENENITQQAVPSTIPQCEELVKSIFRNNSDITIKTFETQKEKAMIVYIDDLINRDLIDRDTIAPLKSSDFDGDISLAIKTHYDEVNDIQTFVGAVLQGNIAVIMKTAKK
ncbi:MAG: hypothetical protein BGN88_12825 [Clostridiales bacterium 43-6]|nr:MAG: hypothetical protein BGN88_12825 [Clostridiales bacterium 43-6]